MINDKLLFYISKNFKNEAIFFTGASGLIGKSLIKTFDKANEVFGSNIKLILLSRKLNNLNDIVENCKNTSISCIEGDIRKFTFREKRVDRIFHFANASASETFNNIDNMEKFDVLVQGTKNILKLGVDYNVKKILFTSSGVVYGDYFRDGVLKVDEEYLGAPKTNNINSSLGEGKRAAELLIHLYGEKYKLDWTNCLFQFEIY